MDNFTLALVVIGDMTLTERRLTARIAELEAQIADGTDTESDEKEPDDA